MKLYEISKEYQDTLHALGEIDELPEEVISDTLDGIAGEFRDKAINVAAYVANLESEAAQVKEAMLRMRERHSKIVSRSGKLRAYLLKEMAATGILEAKNAELVVKVRKNPPSVIVDDESALANQYWKTKTEVTPNRTAIKLALLEGEPVEGAHLDQALRLEIK